MRTGYQRHWDVSVAAIKIWNKIRKGQDTQAAQQLKQSLGALKGPLLKIGQLTSMVPSLVSSEYVQALEELCAHAPPMGWPFVRRRLMTELGAFWQESFEWFKPEASFAASLGQVHKAWLKDGTIVACKIQYPEMDRVIDTDLHQVALLCGLYERIGKAVDTQALQEEWEERLREEIDYLQEQRHLCWFQEIFSQENLDQEIRVPKVIPWLTTRRLLTMTWLEGKPLNDAISLDENHRNHLGKLIFQAWYIPLYHFGILHGDPHKGNITWDKEGINLMDFGCIRVFSPPFVQSVCWLYEALLNEDRDLLVHAYQGWGFTSLSLELIEVLTLWARFLFKPFLKDKVCCLDEVSSPEEGKNLALTIHRLVARQGRILPPREFLIMDRVAVVIGSVLMQLRVRANWLQLMHEVVGGFSIESCKLKQDQILNMPIEKSS